MGMAERLDSRIPCMTGETWLPVAGFEGIYDVSNFGRVRSWYERCGRYKRGALADAPRVMSPTPSAGYPAVILVRAETTKRMKVHWLVARAFLPVPMFKGAEIRHLDGNRANAHVSNLTYGTHSENMHDSIRHGTHVSGFKLMERPPLRTHCVRGHPYARREVLAGGGTHGVCRVCAREAGRRFRERRRAAASV